jgi:hypothetical protein
MSGTRNILLAGMVFSIPLELRSSLVVAHSGSLDPYRHWVLLLIPLDILWAMFTLLSIPVLMRAWKDREITWGMWSTALVAVFMTLAFAVNPSALGLSLTLHMAAAFAVISVIVRFDRPMFRRAVAAPLLATATIQAVLALSEVFLFPGSGIESGPWFTGGGTLYHPYVLSGILLVSVAIAGAVVPQGRFRFIWLTGIAVSAAAIPAGFSRSAALALIIMILAYIWGLVRHRDRYVAPALATIIPTIGVGLVLWRGWLAVLFKNVRPGGLDNISSGRMALIRQSIGLVQDYPLTGVGPGRYLDILAVQHPGSMGSQGFSIVHTVPLAMAAEAGIMLGIGYLAFLAAVGIRAVRTSPAAVVVYGSLITFIIFDKFTYSNTNGILLAAVWLAALDLLARPEFGGDPESVE